MIGTELPAIAGARGGSIESAVMLSKSWILDSSEVRPRYGGYRCGGPVGHYYWSEIASRGCREGLAQPHDIYRHHCDMQGDDGPEEIEPAIRDERDVAEDCHGT